MAVNESEKKREIEMASDSGGESSKKKMKITQQEIGSDPDEEEEEKEFRMLRTIPPNICFELDLVGKLRRLTRGDRKLPPVKTDGPFLPPNWGDHPSPEALKVVEASLRSFNERAINDRSEEFEFVGGLHINAFVDDGIWYHVNFNGKPTNNNEIEPRRFFAELRRTDRQSEYHVVSCQNLGPLHIAHGSALFGCKACDVTPHRYVLFHRYGGFFNVGVSRGFWY